MSYPYLLLICLLMMLMVALGMYYLGIKISYSYILYNASISIGSGVLFFLAKMVFTYNKVGPIEQWADIAITMILLTVWIVCLVETLTIEVVENGREMKDTMISVAKRVKATDYKTIPYRITNQLKTINFKEMPLKSLIWLSRIPVKTKNWFVKNKLKLKIQKLAGDFHKYREINKRV